MTLPKKENKKELESIVRYFLTTQGSLLYSAMLELKGQIPYQMIFLLKMFPSSTDWIIKPLNLNRSFISFYGGFKV